MDKKISECINNIDRIIQPRIIATNNYESAQVAEVFKIAYQFITHTYINMIQSEYEEARNVLINQFGVATSERLDKVHQLLIFWFFWQRDKMFGLKFLKSKMIHDGLKKIWAFSEAEIESLDQEFSLKKEQGEDTFYLWMKIENILGKGSNGFGPTFVFPAMSSSLKNNYIRLDLLTDNGIQKWL